MIKKLISLSLTILILFQGSAVPASAGKYGNQPLTQEDIERELSQQENEIRRDMYIYGAICIYMGL